jgi:hypothetical protein
MLIIQKSNNREDKRQNLPMDARPWWVEPNRKTHRITSHSGLIENQRKNYASVRYFHSFIEIIHG